MLKHVLVPLDGSKLAEQALEHAMRIVQPGGKITLVAAVELPEMPIYDYYPPINRMEYERAQEEILPFATHYLENIADDLKQRGFEVSIRSQVGNAAEVIIDVACRYQVDMIVMSTHGRSGLQRWLYGSITHKVLDTTPCPVYVVPSKSPPNGSQ
jgi:nucleotide-binding universal stress UspA family protein